MNRKTVLKDKAVEIKYNVVDKFKTTDFMVIEKLINQKFARIILYTRE